MVTFLLLTLVLLLPAAWAVTVAIDGEDRVVLGPHYQILEDPSADMDLDAVRQSGRFTAADLGTDPNLGYTASAWWVTVALYSAQGGRRMLELPFPFLDDVRVYLVEPAGGTLLERFSAGDLRPFAERPYPHYNFVFPLQLPAGTRVDLYLRVRTQGSTTIGSAVWQPAAFQLASDNANLLLGIYFGIMVALFAYNGLLYLALRDPAYLWYVLFVSSMTLAQGAWTGLFFAYLWPNWPAWGNLAAVVGFDLAGFFGALFSRTFLDTRQFAPWTDRMLLVSAVVFAILAIGAPWWPYQFHAMVTSVTGMVFPLIAVTAGFQGLRRGGVSARFFLLAWTILLVGTVLLGARNLGLVPTNFLTRYAMQMGSALEMLLLSFALAARITDLRRQREQFKLQAHQDPLTGLANRSMLELELSATIGRIDRGQGALAVLFIDLDGFKLVNDLHGHATGDVLLKVIGQRLKQGSRVGDTVARFGGDEFVVVLEGLQDLSHVMRVAEKLIAEVSKPAIIGDLQLQVGASIGAAVYPADGAEPLSLIASADHVMYEAKRSGRGRVAAATGLAAALRTVASSGGHS